MGLDMYLYAKKFIYTDFNKRKEQREMFKQNPLFADLVEEGITPNVRYVTVEALYWRKANQIHKWFVDNVQNGMDDCGTYDVYRDQLNELKEICQEILLVPELAMDKLPTQEGFFYGETEITEGYFSDLRYTIKFLDECLKYPDTWFFEYTSSW